MELSKISEGLKKALSETMIDNSTPDVVYEFKVRITADQNDTMNKTLKSEIKAALQHCLEDYDLFIEVEDV